MRIVAERSLRAFVLRHPDSGASVEHWRATVRAAQWTSTQDVLRSFSKAKVLNAERVRFEIGGGDYRLIAAMDFRSQAVFVKFLGTHAEYDAVDALTVAEY